MGATPYAHLWCLALKKGKTIQSAKQTETPGCISGIIILSWTCIVSVSAKKRWNQNWTCNCLLSILKIFFTFWYIKATSVNLFFQDKVMKILSSFPVVLAFANRTNSLFSDFIEESSEILRWQKSWRLIEHEHLAPSMFWVQWEPLGLN